MQKTHCNRRVVVRLLRAAIICALLIGCLPLHSYDFVSLRAEEPSGVGATTLSAHVRKRAETAPASGRYHTLTTSEALNPRKTAVIICDMWDAHWCKASSQRVAEMAPRMNEVVKAARKRGMLIIHAPSDTMKFYEGTPGRKLAQAAPKATPKVPLQRWNRIDPLREPPLPIDDSAGGCESHDPMSLPWTRQIETISIEPGDAITDSEEAYYLLEQRGIENVLVMGVHTNFCVLGRPFSIRQMVSQGKHVLLCRDLTDTMYDPECRPFVSHFTGTDLVVEHIERYWCPSITSTDIDGKPAFRFAADRRPHLAIVMAEEEYKAAETLPALAARHLGKDFQVSLVFGNATDRNDLPGLDVIKTADLMLLSMHRRALRPEQMDLLKGFIKAGKPLVGIRTASHGLDAREVPAGYVAWPEFDREVLGCHYQGHHGNKETGDPRTSVWRVESAAGNPILAGFPEGELPVPSWLYKSQPLAEGATLLLMGRVADRQPHEPVAWTWKRPDGGRTFYTSLGSPEDLQIPAIERLLVNGIYWAAGLERKD